MAANLSVRVGCSRVLGCYRLLELSTATKVERATVSFRASKRSFARSSSNINPFEFEEHRKAAGKTYHWYTFFIQ
jgi:hypothetical protein